MRQALPYGSLPVSLMGLICFALPALAQPVPERVEIGNGNMTVGFELKTTTHGDGPEGRTTAHSLLKEVIIPKPGYNWTGEAATEVQRWGQMTLQERTAFFFKHYAGGYNSSNFTVDSARFPFLDKTISWYGSMNIPHIEVRSLPFDNPREALAEMNRLKSSIRETIAFHTHMRFPDTVNGQQGEKLTEWLRRTSWAIALKRADYSSKTDFVLKSMDNQPINPTELEKARRAFTAENPSSQKDIIERRGIRVSRLGHGEDRKIDIEFRGLMRDLGRVESYLGAVAETFGNGAQNRTAAYDARHPVANSSSLDQIQFRTFGMTGKGSWNAAELEWLANEVEKNSSRYGISSSLSQAELREAVKRLATADTEAGKKMLLPSSFNWLFLPLEYDPALPERVQEKVEVQKAKHIEKLVRLAERVHAGEFGQPGNSNYKALAVASRARRILYDFMNVKYRDGNRVAKLFEWYETSVFKPNEIKERTEAYRAETGKNRAAEWEARLAEGATGEGFGRRRAASPTSEVDRVMPGLNAALNDMVRGEFEAVRRGMEGRLAERIASETNPAEKERLERGLERIKGIRFSFTPSMDIYADARGNEVRISAGLVAQVLEQTNKLPSEAQRTVVRQALGLIAGHEAAHVAGVKTERFADAEAVRAYERARGPIADNAIRAAVSVFTRPVGFTRWDNFLNRLKSFVRYGTEAGRIRNLQEARQGEDPLRQYRRADGTLDWKRLSANRALTEVGGLAHFGLALFLQEFARVMVTGDRARIEEFFDGLLTTDFYKHYGLFVAGARVGEVAYVRYLQRYVKPTFLNATLKTNMVLAAGLALPQIVEGTFEGKAFAISLGSLGLSSAAVKAGVRGIQWVYDLKRVRNTGLLTRLGLGGRRFMRIGGWFYTAAELAVVLYLAEEITEFVNTKLDDAAARDALRESSEEFFRAVGDPSLSQEEVEAATDRYHSAWADYRNHLYKPMFIEEARLAERLRGVARDAKLAEDRRQAALARVNQHAALKARIERQHGSLENYADHMLREDEAEIDRKVGMFNESYNKARDGLLDGIYQENRREEAFLGDVDYSDWLLLGGREGAENDPWGSRSDWFAGKGRENAHEALGDAIENVSSNRLQAYEDERDLLLAAASAAERAGLRERAEAIRRVAAQTDVTRGADERLIEGNGMIDTTSQEGIEDALRRMGR